jgi:hypothetical protein
MDLIFKNGNILTAAQARPKAGALAVRCGRIHRVGEGNDVERLAGPQTRVFDLKGQTLVPGFIDTHNHFCVYALLTGQADCRPAAGCVKGEDVIAALKAQAAKTPAGKWIMGWGYASYLLDDKKDLTRLDLDRASKKHPICLVHVSVHGAVVNSLALKKLGFTKKSPNPPGGIIGRDEKGEPNGILSESAFMGPLFFQTPSIYAQMMADYDEAGRVELLARCAARFHRWGIVGAHDPFVDPLTLKTYQVAERTGSFPFRLYAYILNQWADPFLKTGIGRGFGSEWVKIGAVKIFLDGGMSSRTAAVSKPYVYPPGAGRGILNYDQKGINREIEKFNAAGWQISVHAQGDRALGMLLKAFERAIDPGNPLRHHIVHAGNLTSSQIDRVRQINLYIASQANFFSLLGDGFLEAYGPERSRELYRFRTLLEKGIRLGFSSDAPVAEPNPLIGLRDAILRRTASGKDFCPDERLTAEQALALYTREAAYFSFEEKERGTLEEGKRADFTVLDRDPTMIATEEIPNCRVKMTVVGGRVVFSEE